MGVKVGVWVSVLVGVGVSVLVGGIVGVGVGTQVAIKVTEFNVLVPVWSDSIASFTSVTQAVVGQ